MAGDDVGDGPPGAAVWFAREGVPGVDMTCAACGLAGGVRDTAG